MGIPLDEKSAAVDSVKESTCTRSSSDNRASYMVWFTVFVIILLGTLLRGILLDKAYLDFDESMHFQAAREATLTDTWHASRIHTHPPLIFLFYHLWINLGDSEIMLRLPSLLFSISALVFGFLWLKELLGPRPALVGLTILTFTVPMVQLGSVMRGYTLMLMFMFAALYFHERFLRKNSIAALTGSGCCLALALLTHYSSAWLILVLGLLTGLRVLSGTLPRRLVLSWAILQVLLLGMCIAFYFGHIRGFMNSELQSGLWKLTLNNSSYSPETTHPAYLALMRVVEFVMYIAGPLWKLMTGLIVIGSFILLRKGYRDSQSKWIALERSMIVLLPMVVAMLLFYFRIYPVGHLRQAIWLIPFVVAGISAATLPLLKQPGLLRTTFTILALSYWTWTYTYPVFKNPQTSHNPAMAQETVALLKKTIPEGGLILTDDSTRNVLEYYLVGRTVIHGQPLGGGYTEYQMAGYRIVTIPKFHFLMFALKSDWSNFKTALGDDATRPLWVAYFGFQLPKNSPSVIFRRFPPGRLIKKVNHLDNHILNVELRPPEEK